MRDADEDHRFQVSLIGGGGGISGVHRGEVRTEKERRDGEREERRGKGRRERRLKEGGGERREGNSTLLPLISTPRIL